MQITDSACQGPLCATRALRLVAAGHRDAIIIRTHKMVSMIFRNPHVVRGRMAGCKGALLESLNIDNLGIAADCSYRGTASHGRL